MDFQKIIIQILMNILILKTQFQSFAVLTAGLFLALTVKIAIILHIRLVQ